MHFLPTSGIHVFECLVHASLRELIVKRAHFVAVHLEFVIYGGDLV